MTRGQALQAAQRRLADAGMEHALQEARYLLCSVLALSPLDLLNQDTDITQGEMARLQEALARRAGGEPLSRIRGTREFWSLSFHLNEATLDPRPDSETLVDAVLAARPDKTAALRFLDMGTGSGCLLLSLLGEYAQAIGTGTDSSARALEAASANATLLGLASRATFVCTSWAEGVGGQFDVVLSNPPYIRSDALAGLDRAVKDFDPLAALDGGQDGLQAYRALLPQAARHLVPGGLVVLEIGAGQEADVAALLVASGFTGITMRRDLGGHIRVVMGKRD